MDYCQFSIASIGKGQTSLGRYVAAAVKAFNDIDGLDYDVTAMGTIHSTKDLDIIFAAVTHAHDAVIVMCIKGVESTLRIGGRQDKLRMAEDKVKAIL